MATARYSNRIGRRARINPGHHHLEGADVTAHMQRQYEAILKSMRARHEYDSDAKRKQVAAATVRSLAHNPGELERAEKLTKAFHGRSPRETFEIIETEYFDEFGSVLGYLEELCILDPDDDDYGTPISFPFSEERGESANGPDNPDTVLVVSNPEGTNIEFVGGDQDIDWHNVEGAGPENDKYLIPVGSVGSIAYWTDKHHLSGPISQRDGTAYEHSFGDEGGQLPFLVFDQKNSKLLLVGGSYTITPEGIAG